MAFVFGHRRVIARRIDRFYCIGGIARRIDDLRRMAFAFGHRRVIARRIDRFYCFNLRHGIAFAAIVRRLGLKQDLLAAWSVVRGVANQRICSDRQEGVFARRDLSPLGDTGAGWDQLADYDILF